MNRPYISEIVLNKPDGADEGAYPFSLPVVKNLDRLRLEGGVTFLVGENGTGKSTLLEAVAICCGFNPEGGSKNFNFATMASHSELYKYIKLIKSPLMPRDGYFQRAESFYNVASEIERLDDGAVLGVPIKASYGGKSLHEQSHGESFLSLMMHRFSGDGLYLLDEPEAALSPASQMALLVRIHQLVGRRSQFIIATHSPILMSYPGARIFVLTQDAVTLTPYRETEHYMITRQFMNNPEGMLKHLLD